MTSHVLSSNLFWSIPVWFYHLCHFLYRTYHNITKKSRVISCNSLFPAWKCKQTWLLLNFVPIIDFTSSQFPAYEKRQWKVCFRVKLNLCMCFFSFWGFLFKFILVVCYFYTRHYFFASAFNVCETDSTLFFCKTHFIRTSKLRLCKKIRINQEQNESRITFSKN